MEERIEEMEPYFEVIQKSLQNLTYASHDRSIKAQELLKQVEVSINRRFDIDKPIIVLDMDETLLSAVQELEGEFSERRSGAFMPPDLELVQTAEISEEKRTTLVTYRPGLFPFLENLKQKLNIIVYTAGTQDYAEPILNCIDPDGEIFAAKLYRHNCIPSGRYFLKDLSIIQEAFNIEKEEIILLDNSLISFALCMDQGIPISDFNGEAGEKEDQELEFAA